MKSWILSSDSEIASTQSLLRALKKAGFETEVLNPLELQVEFGSKRPTFFRQGQKLRTPSVAFPRLGWDTLEYGLRIAWALQSAHCKVFNSPASIAQASDKLTSLQIFQEKGLPIPKTRFAHSSVQTEYHLFAKDSAHVFKTLQGSQGFGVVWQTHRRQSLAQADAFRNLAAPFLAQELLQESFGTDVRAFVVNGKIAGAMKRQSQVGDLRSNLHQQGKATRTTLTLQEKELALKAAAALGLHYAGVDFLRSRKGPLLLEANPSPGFEGISKACRLDVAALLIESLTKNIN